MPRFLCPFYPSISVCSSSISASPSAVVRATVRQLITAAATCRRATTLRANGRRFLPVETLETRCLLSAALDVDGCAGLSFAIYDPDQDPDGSGARLVVDLVGVVRAAGTSGGGYTALRTPVRAADTRTGLGLPRGLLRGSARLSLLDVVPAGATGVVLNVTATNGSAPGFVVVSPDGTDLPETSNVTFPAGLTQANEALSRLGTGRAVTVTVSGARRAAAHVVVDVVGYTTAPSA